MDIPTLQYSRHARRRMRRYGISEEEVELIVWAPAFRIATGSEVEHCGYSYDGRYFTVVTNGAETKVVTIYTDEGHRPRVRRKKR